MANGYGIEFFQKEHEKDVLFSVAKVYNVSVNFETSMLGNVIVDERKFESEPYYISRKEVIDLIEKKKKLYMVERISDKTYTCMPISLSINNKGYINDNKEKEEDYVKNIRIKDY